MQCYTGSTSQLKSDYDNHCYETLKHSSQDKPSEVLRVLTVSYRASLTPQAAFARKLTMYSLRGSAKQIGLSIIDDIILISLAYLLIYLHTLCSSSSSSPPFS